jgi:hypothetical protein
VAARRRVDKVSAFRGVRVDARLGWERSGHESAKRSMSPSYSRETHFRCMHLRSSLAKEMRFTKTFLLQLKNSKETRVDKMRRLCVYIGDAY